MTAPAASRPAPSSPAPHALAAFLPYLLVAGFHLAMLAADLDDAARISKLLLMPTLALAVVLVVRPRRSRAALLLLAGVLFSWGGDAPLTIPGDGWFVFGLSSFLVAHLCYLALFAWGGLGLRAPRPWALVYLAWYGVLMVLLWPHLGGLALPVAAYGLVLCAMAAVSSGLTPTVACGGALFVVSDSLLALNRFVPDYAFGLNDVAVMLSYIAAQGLIAWGVVVILRSRSAPGAGSDAGSRTPSAAAAAQPAE